MLRKLLLLVMVAALSPVWAQRTFVVAELNCENLFDCKHDEGKEDTEFLPDATRRWTPWRLYKKLELLGKTLAAIGGEHMPDLVALCEVENDSVMERMTRRSILWPVGYQYCLTRSLDPRGINVALLYRPETFNLLTRRDIRPDFKGLPRKRTRDVLYASGLLQTGDTLDVFVVHAPSRIDGHRGGRDYRRRLMQQIRTLADSVMAARAKPQIIITGDFNDPPEAACMLPLEAQPVKQSHEAIDARCLYNLTTAAHTTHKEVKGTYCYKGLWERIDQMVVSGQLLRAEKGISLAPGGIRIADEAFLLQWRDGQLVPKRTYYGMRWQGGLSDHLPLVATFVYSW